ncbi:HD domain-containing protein [Tepidibacter sp. Z1-5]|uniref:HD domain-containing protein n=1 Tax=Tepidibacter sp. Z1-5 TaxID=3134138 RepID=UPI0030BEB1DD
MKQYVRNFNEKIIRDSLHGDIFIPNKFLDIIDTPEFQRLRRIKQLAVANLIFPGAEHTRFSHSIGAYHIMNEIILHFQNIFRKINIDEINITDRDRDIALAAALLHDIGHGPFSHAFEDIFLINNKNLKHEDWTIRIITDKNSNVNKVLVRNFGSTFPQEVANLIDKQRTIEENGFNLKNVKKIDLNFILSTLISSQLDADRMDYLLRDSLNTGVKYGTIDISRIISSMTITIYEDNYYICILEKYLSDIEQYLIGRHQMYKEVYYNKFKCEMELLIKKILCRAKELYDTKKFTNIFIPTALISFFEGNDITIEEYISLDDYILMGLFNIWKDSDDNILSQLCSCLINRMKYNKVEVINDTKENIYEFKNELINILNKNKYYIENLKNEYFWLELDVDHKIYNFNIDNILIQTSEGTLRDLSQISKIITKEINEIQNMMFINYDMLKHINSFENIDLLIKEIKELINRYNSRTHIEIEKKYYFREYKLFEKIIESLYKYKNYEIEENSLEKQIDYYYDTKDKVLLKTNRSLRIREKSGKYYLTIKTPTINCFNKKNIVKNERFEHEIPIWSNKLEDYKEFIVKYIPEFKNVNFYDQINNILTVINKRKKFYILKGDLKFEMAFDDVVYLNSNKKEEHEYQLEIELKSDYLHKINLKLLCDYIEEQLCDLKVAVDSKYKRGLELTKD